MSFQRYVQKNRTFKRYYGEEDKIGTLELYVDWEKLTQALGRRAAWNKSGKSGLAIGIKAKFVQGKS